MSLSPAALSKASLCVFTSSSRSATLSLRLFLSSLSSFARSSHSFIACAAVSNSSLAIASRCINSSRSLTQFCCDIFARFRSSVTSDSCMVWEDVRLLSWDWRESLASRRFEFTSSRFSISVFCWFISSCADVRYSLHYRQEDVIPNTPSIVPLALSV